MNHEGTKPRRGSPTKKTTSCLSGFVVLICVSLVSGCAQPSKANIDLRKQINDLKAEVARLNRQHEADLATIEGLKGATTVPSLPEDRVAQLFTTHGLKFGRLTGPADLDPKTPGDDGLKVFICPTDDEGQALKAAGSFEVDAFDLSASGDTRVGHWMFDIEQSRQRWVGAAMMYQYVLACPWKRAPEHEQVTVRVKFTDALTGRVFTAQRVVQVKSSSNSSL